MANHSEQTQVILGVDTHLNVHVGAVVSESGKLLGTYSTSTDVAGNLKLICWARSFGTLDRAGVEGTGTYGAGLARVLHEQGINVFEINRPNRAKRRLRGKSDPTDAENAARVVLSGEATAIPKLQDGAAEAMRTLSVARRSAVKAKTQAINQLRALLVSGPVDIREKLWRAKPEQCVAACARLKASGTTVRLTTLTMTLRLLARRWLALAQEIKEFDAALDSVTSKSVPTLRSQFGVGPQTAATLIATVGDNPERLRSESALAAICGACPLQASSGKTIRHRLNRGGDRNANNALWTIAMVRMRSEPRTRSYVAKRSAEGMSTKEIQRCLKRYIIRELYPVIMADLSMARKTS